MESENIRLGIVVPMANEEATVIELLTRICGQIGPADRVFCIIDKSCKDRTRELVQKFGECSDPRVAVIWAPENRCVVDAYFRGYKAAYVQGCMWILEMDAGLSHSPEEIPLFIRGMEAGFDYVGGSRFMEGGRHRSRISRRFISRGGSILARLFLRVHLTDMTSGFECFTREAMGEVLNRGVKSRANFFQTEIRYMMSRWRCKEVPIVYSNNKWSIGRSSLGESFRILFLLWWARKKS